jgi:hypothetical protein
MGTIVGPDYFDTVVETSTGFDWNSINNTLQESFVATTDHMNGAFSETKELSYYNWGSRASVPTDATINEMTYRFRARADPVSVPVDYVGNLYAKTGWYQTTDFLTSFVTYTVTATTLGLTNAERLLLIHATSTADSTDFEVRVDNWGLPTGGTAEMAWITLEVDWSPAASTNTGGILLAK